ncbi:hypothetical protein F5I97DRAFT_1787089, partial [Phlebopus sp. FC_14]
MPAFDPVRDAVLNSPVGQSLALPTGHPQDIDTDKHERHPYDVSSPSSRPSSSRATGSPSITRRATDLAVLLNTDPQEARTPSSARPSGLSHLLLANDAAQPGQTEKLSGAASLQRRTS